MTRILVSLFLKPKFQKHEEGMHSDDMDLVSFAFKAKLKERPAGRANLTNILI